MKAVLISIHPRHCEKIASSKKTFEVRKTAPKIPTPFKCYIYMTKSGNNALEIVERNGNSYAYSVDYKMAGTVVGEFVCDEITCYEGEFWDDETYECVRERYEPDDFEEYGEYEYETIADNEQENYKDVPLFKKSCLTWEELREYLGKGDHVFYGWRISDLKIYDKPKKLGKFIAPCKWGHRIDDEDYECLLPRPEEKCQYECADKNPDGSVNIFTCGLRKPFTRPPQSWMYVEELE